MSSPSTQETLTVLEQAEYLGMSIRVQMSTVSPVLEGIFNVPASNGGGEPRPQFDWNHAQINNLDLLDDGIEDVQGASATHRVAKIQVTEVTRTRRDQVTGLRSHHRSLQMILKGSCGSESLKLVGLDVPPAKSMLGVREQYGLIYSQMKNPALPAKLARLAESVVGGSAPDTDSLSTKMARQIKTFEGTQTGWTQAKKVADRAYAAKRAAHKRLRRIVVNVARIQEGYYRLAGFDDLADRMRLTIPVSKSKKEEDAASQASDDSTP